MESNGWASERVLLGRALADRMPTTAAGWEAGELGLKHATVIREATVGLGTTRPYPRTGAVLAEAAPHVTPGDLGKFADEVKAAIAPADAEAKAQRNRDSQRLHISKTFDGVRVDGWLDTEAGAEVAAALAAFTRKRDPNLPLGDDRSPAAGLKRYASWPASVGRAEAQMASGSGSSAARCRWRRCRPGWVLPSAGSRHGDRQCRPPAGVRCRDHPAVLGADSES